MAKSAQYEQIPILLRGGPLSIKCKKCLHVFSVMASCVMARCPECDAEHYLDPAGRVWGPEALANWRRKVGTTN